MTIPGWLFDQVADGRRDMPDLRAKVAAWDDLLAGAEEVLPEDSEAAKLARAMQFARDWAQLQRDRAADRKWFMSRPSRGAGVPVDCIRPEEHAEHHHPHRDGGRRLVCHVCHTPAHVIRSERDVS